MDIVNNKPPKYHTREHDHDLDRETESHQIVEQNYAIRTKYFKAKVVNTQEKVIVWFGFFV